MGPIYLNPDRINYVMEIMNQYAVNGVVDGNNADYKAAMAKAEEMFPTPQINYIQVPKTETNQSGYAVEYTFTQDQLNAYEENTGGAPKVTNYNKFMNEESRDDDSIPAYIPLSEVGNVNVIPSTPAATTPATTTPQPVAADLGSQGSPQPIPDPKTVYMRSDHGNSFGAPIGSSWIYMKDRDTGQTYAYDQNEGKSGEMGWHGAEPPAGANLQITSWIDTRPDDNVTYDLTDQNLTFGGQIDPATSAAYQAQADHQPGYEKRADQAAQNQHLAELGFFDSKPLLDDFFGFESTYHPDSMYNPDNTGTTSTTTTTGSGGQGTSSMSFDDAFSSARNSGASTFTWNGNEYTTELAPSTSESTTPEYNMFGDVVTSGVNDDVTLANQSIAAQNNLAAQDNETFDAMGGMPFGVSGGSSSMPTYDTPIGPAQPVQPEIYTPFGFDSIPDTSVLDQTKDTTPLEDTLTQSFVDDETFDAMGEIAPTPNAEGIGYDIGDTWTVDNPDGSSTTYTKEATSFGPQVKMISSTPGGDTMGGPPQMEGPQMSGGISGFGPYGGPGPVPPGPSQGEQYVTNVIDNIVTPGIDAVTNFFTGEDETPVATDEFSDVGTTLADQTDDETLDAMGSPGFDNSMLYDEQLWQPLVDGDDFSKLETTYAYGGNDPFDDQAYFDKSISGNNYTLNPNVVAQGLQHYADLARALQYNDVPKGLEHLPQAEINSIKQSINNRLDTMNNMANVLKGQGVEGFENHSSNTNTMPGNASLIDMGQKDLVEGLYNQNFTQKQEAIGDQTSVGSDMITTGEGASIIEGDPNLITPTLASLNQLDDKDLDIGEGITTGGTSVGASVTPEEAMNFGKDDETFDAMGASMNMFGDMGIEGESDDTTLMAQESAAAGATGQIVPGKDFAIDPVFWPEDMSLGKALYNNIFGEGAVDTYGEYVGQTINDAGASAAAGFLEGPLAKGLQGSAMYMDRVKNWLTGANQMDTSTFESGVLPAVSWLEEAAANVYDEMSPQMQDRVTGNANFDPNTTWGEIFSGTAKMQSGANMFDDKTALAVKGMEDFYDVVLDVVTGLGLGKKGLALVMGTSASEGFASADEQAQQSITNAINDGSLNLQEIADKQFNGDIEAAENEARNSARFIAGVLAGPVAGIGDTIIGAGLGVGSKPIASAIAGSTLGKSTVGQVVNPLLNIGGKTTGAALTGGTVEAGEQVATNIAEQQAGLDTGLGDGTAAAFGQGVIGQGVPGGIAATGTEVQALGTGTNTTPEGIQTTVTAPITQLNNLAAGIAAGDGTGATGAADAGIAGIYETADGTANIPMNTIDDASSFEDGTVAQTTPVNTGFVPTGETVGQTAQTPETVVTSYDTQPDTTTFAGGTAGTSGNTLEELMAAEDVIKNEVAETGELSIETATKLSNELNMPFVDITNMAEEAMGLTPSQATGEGVTTGTGMVPEGGPGTFEVGTNQTTDTTPTNNQPMNVDVISSEDFQKLQDEATENQVNALVNEENLDKNIADQIAKVEEIASNYGIDTTLTPDMDTAVLQPEQQLNMFGDTVDDFQGVDDNVLAQQEQLAAADQETVDTTLTPDMEQAVFEDTEGNQLPAGVLDFTDDGITQSQLEDVKDTLDDETLDAMGDIDITDDETLDAMGGQVEVEEGDTFQDVLDKLDEAGATLDPDEDAIVVDTGVEEADGSVIELPDLTKDDETLDAMADAVDVEIEEAADEAADVEIEAADETDDETLDALGDVDVEIADETDDETLDAMGDTETSVPETKTTYLATKTVPFNDKVAYESVQGTGVGDSTGLGIISEGGSLGKSNSAYGRGFATEFGRDGAGEITEIFSGDPNKQGSVYQGVMSQVKDGGKTYDVFVTGVTVTEGGGSRSGFFGTSVALESGTYSEAEKKLALQRSKELFDANVDTHVAKNESGNYDKIKQTEKIGIGNVGSTSDVETNISTETTGVNKQAADLLNKIETGELDLSNFGEQLNTPGSIPNNLKVMLDANGIEITSDMTAQQGIDALKDKADVEVTDETDDETFDAMGDETTEVEVPAVEDETDDETLDAMGDETTEVEVPAVEDETDDETLDAMAEDTTEVEEKDDGSAEVIIPAQTTTETLTGIGTEGTSGIGSTAGATTTGTTEVEVDDEVEEDIEELEEVALDPEPITDTEVDEEVTPEEEVEEEVEEEQKKTIIPPTTIDTDQPTDEDTEVELDEEVDQTIDEETEQTVDEEIEEDIDQTIDEETEQTIDEDTEEDQQKTPIVTTDVDPDVDVTPDPVITVDVPEEEEEEEDEEVIVDVVEDEEIPATVVSADSDSDSDSDGETSEDVEFECPDGYIKVQQADGTFTCVKESVKMAGRRKISTSPYFSKKGFAGKSPYPDSSKKITTKTYTDPIKV